MEGGAPVMKITQVGVTQQSTQPPMNTSTEAISNIGLGGNSGSSEIKIAAKVIGIPESRGARDASDDPTFDEEVIKNAVDQANKTLLTHDRRIERAVHEVTHTVMYTVKDTKTDEVIAEFPPKKIQDMVAKMWELAGLFVDEKA